MANYNRLGVNKKVLRPTTNFPYSTFRFFNQNKDFEANHKHFGVKFFFTTTTTTSGSATKFSTFFCSQHLSFFPTTRTFHPTLRAQLPSSFLPTTHNYPNFKCFSSNHDKIEANQKRFVLPITVFFPNHIYDLRPTTTV